MLTKRDPHASSRAPRGDNRARFPSERTLVRGAWDTLTDLWKVENQPEALQKGPSRDSVVAAQSAKQSRRSIDRVFLSLSSSRPARPLALGGVGREGRGQARARLLARCSTHEKDTHSRLKRGRRRPSPRVAGGREKR